MKAIVRKRQRRILVEDDKRELVFIVRESIVDPQKIDRWIKRNDIPGSSLYIPSPATSTPSAVHCRTVSKRGSPVPSPIYLAPIFLLGGIISATQSP